MLQPPPDFHSSQHPLPPVPRPALRRSPPASNRLCLQVLVWNPFTQYGPIHKLKGHDKQLVGLACIPGSTEIVTCDASGKVMIWDTRTYSCIQVCPSPLCRLKRPHGAVRTCGSLHCLLLPHATPPPPPPAMETTGNSQGKGKWGREGRLGQGGTRRTQGGERLVGTTADGGKGSKGRAANGDRPIGATRCTRERYTEATCQPPPPPPLLSRIPANPPTSAFAPTSLAVFKGHLNLLRFAKADGSWRVPDRGWGSTLRVTDGG